MLKKIILGLTVLVVMSGWPLSLIVNPPKFETGLIWQLDDAAEERKSLLQKLGLDATRIKQIFYNNKTTILSERYINNILIMMNLNYYFSGNHPQVDFTDVDNRMKFPYPAVIGFLAGVYISVKKKIHLKVWAGWGAAVLIISLFKKMDGWNAAIYPIIGIITVDGLKEISKYKFGWVLILLITTVGLTEIARLMP